jgi:hypothetical protein
LQWINPQKTPSGPRPCERVYSGSGHEQNGKQIAIIMAVSDTIDLLLNKSGFDRTAIISSNLK